MYEYLLAEIATAGKNGQFRTPRHIIQMMAELVDPKLGESVCDPACGTGGFLLGAYHHILTQYTSEDRRFTDENGIVKGESIWTVSRWYRTVEKKFLFEGRLVNGSTPIAQK